MRDHLATLLDDFRRYGHEIAVVRYQGNRRRVTTYGELAQLAGRFAALLERRGIGRRRPRAAVGREQRRVDRGLLRLHAARRAGRAAGCGRSGGFCRSRGQRCEAEAGAGRRAAAGAVAAASGRAWPSKTCAPLSRPRKRAPWPGSRSPRRCRFSLPPAPRANPKGWCSRTATCWPAWDRSRKVRSPTCATSGWCIRCAFCTRCRSATSSARPWDCGFRTSIAPNCILKAAWPRRGSSN